mgnify:CR=1 FL=1
MGYFDLNSNRPENIKLTLYELSKEIERESGSEKLTADEIVKKFKNSHGSGIVNHLEKHLKFYVDEYDDFQKLQLLKLLYYYEKDGQKIKLTEILKKPRLENIESVYETDTLYGKYFSELKDKLEAVIGFQEAKKRKEQIYRINQRWNNILANILMYAYSEEGLKPENRQFTIFDLKNAKRFIEDRIWGKLSEPKHHLANEDIFTAFYTMLITHEMVCEQEDRIASYESADIYPEESKEYVREFVKLENSFITEDEQNGIIDELICGSENVNIYRYLIFKKKGSLEKSDIDDLRFVKKHLPTLRKWIMEHKDTGKTNRIYAAWFITAVQEVIYCKNYKIAVVNDAYGILEGRRTLTAILKKPETAQAKHIQMWMIRIENRYSANIGSSELLVSARETEKIYTKIRRWMLQFHNMSDIEFVDNALVHFVERIAIPRWVAGNMLEELERSLHERLPEYIIDFQLLHQIYDLGRELAYDKEAVKNIVWLISKQVENFEQQHFILKNEKEIKDRIFINYSNGKQQEFVLDYWVFRHQAIQFRAFFGVLPDEITEKYSEYGLKKFLVDESNLAFFQ